MTCRLGALLLTASNVKVLGGSVQVLEENSFWNVLHQAMYVCQFYFVFFTPFNILSKAHTYIDMFLIPIKHQKIFNN